MPPTTLNSEEPNNHAQNKSTESFRYTTPPQHPQ